MARRMTLLDDARLIASTLHLSGTPAEIAARVAAARDANWARLVHHADGHTLTPLLYQVWRQAGALGTVPPEVRDRMAQAYADNGVRNGHTREDLLDVHQILTEAGVRHMVLKGWALVERLYSDPAQRFMSDLDFLLPDDQAELGHQALRAAGFRPLPPKDEWIEKHLPPLWRNDGYPWDGYLYDPHYPRPAELHVRLWEDNWRGLDVRPLPDPWAEAVTRTVAGVPMQVLSDEDSLVHLAMHFAGHLVERDPRLNQLLDLARFAERCPQLNWDRVLSGARAAQVGRFVYASLFLANTIFGAPLPPVGVWERLASQTPPGLRDWLTEHGPADVLTADYRRRERGKDYALTFLAAQSAAERLGIIRFAALPPLGQLMAKYNLRYRWLGALLYPRYLVERSVGYGRSILRKAGPSSPAG